jgi:hypothetical protein
VVVVAASDAGAVIKGLGALGQEAIDIGTLAARDDGEPVRLEGGPWSAS